MRATRGSSSDQYPVKSEISNLIQTAPPLTPEREVANSNPAGALTDGPANQGFQVLCLCHSLHFPERAGLGTPAQTHAHGSTAARTSAATTRDTRGGRGLVRPVQARLRGAARHFLGDPQSDDAQSAGSEHRPPVPLGDLRPGSRPSRPGHCVARRAPEATGEPIVTEIVPAETFWKAEEYHSLLQAIGLGAATAVGRPLGSANACRRPERLLARSAARGRVVGLGLGKGAPRLLAGGEEERGHEQARGEEAAAR